MIKFVIRELSSGHYFCGNEKSVKWTNNIMVARFYSCKNTCFELMRLNIKDDFTQGIFEIIKVYVVK